uniref:Uncharacterized protein n=1 Tax=Yersinia pseudotuberculosis TaxID=633 RepID=B7UF21_YERPU|nr:hypothetical protein pGDT4_0020 [Yersinia pseudotuberculosis]
MLQPPFPDDNSAPETTSTIQKYRFIVRSLLRPLHDATTGDKTVNTSTRTRLRLQPLEILP